jgi:hypothetical protein
MSLMVKMSLEGHTERFETAVSWYATDDGGLILWPQDKANHQPVAQFASGAWLAVFEAQPKTSDGIRLAARRAPTDKAVRSA